MKKVISVILLLAFMLGLAACGKMSVDETVLSETEAIEQTKPTDTAVTNPTEESVAARLTTYPLNVRKAYSDCAVSLPAHIYTTTGEESGLTGTIYIFEGTVEKITTYPDETGTFTFEDAEINTEGGTVTVTNLYKSIYESIVSTYGEAAAKAAYSEDENNYVFPEEGTCAQFIAVYMGYSMTNNMPTFILGASPAIFEICEYDDPVADDNQATETTVPPTTGSEATTPETTEPTAGSEPEPTEPSTAEKETEPAETETPNSGATAGEKNALSSAITYLRVMPFSYGGLVDQLLYEGYTTEEATYAANNCGADWNSQALRSAKNYLSAMPFSYSGLINQLQYEQYTASQATYGADNCGADWYAQAARSGAVYLSIMSFSREDLISQLQYEGFTYDQAVYGADANGL